MADTLDLGSSAARRAGSSPVSGNPAKQDKHVDVVSEIRLDGGSLPPTSTYDPDSLHHLD